MTAKAMPARLNIALVGGTVLSLCGLLWLASHAGSWWLVLLAAVAFSFVNNTAYSLMHEAVHRHLHPDAEVNEAAGRLLAAFFPTAFSLQRVFHLAHHRNNRTEQERFDYYRPDENRLVKFAQWYCILTGLYWFLSPLFCIVYFFAADALRRRPLFGAKGGWFSRQTSAGEFLDAVETVPVRTARLDILFAFAVQAASIWLLDLSLLGWCACYAAFAINWSSLQYTDHAFSPLDRHEGAWNLKVGPLSRLVFLNYHFHLVHHRDPSIPWIDLPRFARADDPSPRFWTIYWKMWKGPRPVPAAAGIEPPAAVPPSRHGFPPGGRE